MLDGRWRHKRVKKIKHYDFGLHGPLATDTVTIVFYGAHVTVSVTRKPHKKNEIIESAR